MPDPQKIRFGCPECGTSLAIAEQNAGKLGKCPNCGRRVRIPSARSLQSERSNEGGVEGPRVAEPGSRSASTQITAQSRANDDKPTPSEPTNDAALGAFLNSLAAEEPQKSFAKPSALENENRSSMGSTSGSLRATDNLPQSGKSATGSNYSHRLAMQRKRARRIWLTLLSLFATLTVVGGSIYLWRVFASQGVKDGLEEKLARAAEIPAKDLRWMKESATKPRLSDVESQTLTIGFFLLDEIPENPSLRFLDSRRPPSEVARILRGDHETASLLHPEFIRKIDVDAVGSRATGIVRFRVPHLVEGEATFAAEKRDGEWIITELRLPATGWTTKLINGKWKADITKTQTPSGSKKQADLHTAHNESWQLDDVKLSYAVEIDGGFQKIVAKNGGKIFVVTGKLSHSELQNATISEKEVTLSYRVLQGAAVRTVQPVAFGLVRTHQTAWIMPGPIVKGEVKASDENKVFRIRVSRVKGKSAVFGLMENQSHVAFAFSVPSDGKGPFELRIGELKTDVSLKVDK